MNLREKKSQITSPCYDVCSLTSYLIRDGRQHHSDDLSLREKTDGYALAVGSIQMSISYTLTPVAHKDNSGTNFSFEGKDFPIIATR